MIDRHFISELAPELTSREAEVVAFLSNGHDLQAAATIMGVKYVAARKIFENVMRKLGVRQQSAVVAVVLKRLLAIPDDTPSENVSGALVGDEFGFAEEQFSSEQAPEKPEEMVEVANQSWVSGWNWAIRTPLFDEEQVLAAANRTREPYLFREGVYAAVEALETNAERRTFFH